MFDQEFTIPINGKPIYAVFTALIPCTTLGHHLQQPPHIHITYGWAPHNVDVPSPRQQFWDAYNEVRPRYARTEMNGGCGHTYVAQLR